MKLRLDNNDGTVTDQTTSLMWQQDDGGIKYIWRDAKTACKNLSLAGYMDWRLPNIKELSRLLDGSAGYYKPKIDIVAFPTTQFSSYWSSTVQNKDRAWASFFTSTGVGGVSQEDPAYSYAHSKLYARCVR